MEMSAMIHGVSNQHNGNLGKEFSSSKRTGDGATSSISDQEYSMTDQVKCFNLKHRATVNEEPLEDTLLCLIRSTEHGETELSLLSEEEGSGKGFLLLESTRDEAKSLISNQIEYFNLKYSSTVKENEPFEDTVVTLCNTIKCALKGKEGGHQTTREQEKEKYLINLKALALQLKYGYLHRLLKTINIAEGVASNANNLLLLQEDLNNFIASYHNIMQSLPAYTTMANTRLSKKS